MKKLGAFLVCAVMAFGLVGCGSGDSTESKSTTQAETQTEVVTDAVNEADTSNDNADSTVSEEQTSEESSADETDNVDTETGKTLVIYFSATGNTKDAAEYIAAETGADIFEITPAQEYTSDDLNYNDDSSRVSKEHNDESLRDVELTTTEVPGWESYDTVFVGYPIWWGTSAWPVCTSASSGLGSSADDLASEAGSGDWKDGQRFSSGVTQQDVADWISGLGLGQ